MNEGGIVVDDGELAKWAVRLKDKWWRLCNLYAIEDRKGRLIKFAPNLAQADFYRNMWWLNYVLKARQMGFSTFIGIFILDRLLFEANKTAGIIDHTLDDAKKKLGKMALAYENLDNKALHPETWELGVLLKMRTRLITDSRQELAWSNKSAVYCGTSLRGGTIQYLHISELGKTSVTFPDKAREIVEGALNAIHEGGIGFIETTHEGGRAGEAYRICKQAMEATGQARNGGRTLTRLDFRFHFFPWWREPQNVLSDAVEESPEMRKYFFDLEVQGVKLSSEQRVWYCKKAEQQKLAMLKEHPSTAEEAFQALVTGSIYGREIAALRAQGRICDFQHNGSRPMYTFWDIGMSDFTSIWLVQFDGREILWRAWHEDNGRAAGHYADVCRAWEERYRIRIAGHYLPHDAAQRDRGTGKTYVEYLREAGLANVMVVPRTPDVWVGINHLRDLLPRSWFHLTDCGTPRMKEGVEFPSGIACLEAYHTQDIQGGAVIQEQPVHDESSHTASAARTLGEAIMRGMVNADGNTAGMKPKVTVRTGFRGTGRAANFQR